MNNKIKNKIDKHYDNPFISFPIYVKLLIPNPWNVTSIVVNSIQVNSTLTLVHSQYELNSLSTISDYLVISNASEMKEIDIETIMNKEVQNDKPKKRSKKVQS